ncbi:hypothetical protein [Microbulbifer sediminum]|uniref:hypothetical protein n=1 Tax=Microbulbifer sediminum TaxID=2904250 RepID=UPI001F261CBB|nr:hypothetical protein [Microbulbifer sediminum]
MKNKKEEVRNQNKQEKILLGRKLARELSKDEAAAVGAGTSPTPDQWEPKYERLN